MQCLPCFSLSQLSSNHMQCCSIIQARQPYTYSYPCETVMVLPPHNRLREKDVANMTCSSKHMISYEQASRSLKRPNFTSQVAAMLKNTQTGNTLQNWKQLFETLIGSLEQYTSMANVIFESNFRSAPQLSIDNALEVVRDMIAAMEAAEAKMKETRLQFSALYNHILSPIHRIPDETLLQILEYASGEDTALRTTSLSVLAWTLLSYAYPGYTCGNAHAVCGGERFVELRGCFGVYI